ncbi:MAG: YebC/PmpR family DNA-binding transcriptional regulator, partial [Bdellovibrionales bacterium]|nr:YebC/PmpR family DNA-binding transcriptional regulator [Bdellovibrionales bacterium]
IKCLTDNKNRTVAEVRHCLSRNGGSLAGSNAVAYLFQDKGIFTLSKSEVSEEELFEVVLEAGAEDVKDEGDYWEVHCPIGDFGAVRDALEEFGKPFEGEVLSVPDSTVPVEGKDAETTLKLMEALDDLDDTQSVTANFEIDDATMEAMG